MSSYLTTVTNGTLQTHDYFDSDAGLHMYDAVDPQTRRLRNEPPNPTLAFERLEPEGEIIAFFSRLYGACPFTTGGGIIDWAPDVGYALGSQTPELPPHPRSLDHWSTRSCTSGSATR